MIENKCLNGTSVVKTPVKTSSKNFCVNIHSTLFKLEESLMLLFDLNLKQNVTERFDQRALIYAKNH